MSRWKLSSPRRARSMPRRYGKTLITQVVSLDPQALHHYNEIGLLSPSLRSGSGWAPLSRFSVLGGDRSKDAEQWVGLGRRSGSAHGCYRRQGLSGEDARSLITAARRRRSVSAHYVVTSLRMTFHGP